MGLVAELGQSHARDGVVKRAGRLAMFKGSVGQSAASDAQDGLTEPTEHLGGAVEGRLIAAAPARFGGSGEQESRCIKKQSA